MAATFISSLGQSGPKPTTSTAGTSFTGAPGPYLPQVLQPIPDPQVVKTQWDSMFPNVNQSPTFYADNVKNYLANLPKPATVMAPQVAPVQVAFPSGDADRLAQSLYNQQAGMAIRELERREGQGSAALNANLAQTGLADSGVGVGQNAKLRREFDEQIGATSNAIAEGAVAKSLEAKLAVAQQQATVTLQENLANAQMDYGAQQVNARNILEQGAFSAQAYTTALGLDAAYADRLRGDFINFLDSKTKASLGQSEVARAVLADIFNAILQDKALEIKTGELALQKSQQATQKQQFATSLEFDQSKLASDTALGYAQIQGQKDIAAMNKNQPDRRLMYDGAGESPYSASTAYGRPSVLGSGIGGL